MSLFNIQPIFVPPVILWNISLRKFWDFRQPETIGGTNLSTIGACWRKSLHYISKIFFKIQVGGLLNEGGTSDRWKISLQISLKLDFFKEHQWHIWFFWNIGNIDFTLFSINGKNWNFGLCGAMRQCLRTKANILTSSQPDFARSRFPHLTWVDSCFTPATIIFVGLVA